MRVKRVRSELMDIVKQAMKKKDISSYKELFQKIGANVNPHFSDVFTGRQKIKETELLKISDFLDIPMETFKKFMKTEVKYYVEEYIEMPDYEEIKRNRTREYQKLYKRKQRVNFKKGE